MDGQFQPYQALQMLEQGHQAVAMDAQSFTFVGSVTSNSATLNFGALSAGTLAAGDLLVYTDYGYTSGAPPTAVTPSGFTNLINSSVADGARGMISYKIAAGSEGSVTGMNATNDDKVGMVFRPSIAIASVSAPTTNSQATASNPASQTVDPSAETVPVIIVGAAAHDTATAAFSTASPAFDATITTTGSDLIVGYKIYNSSPASHSIDMNDLGSANWLASLYLKTT